MKLIIGKDKETENSSLLFLITFYRKFIVFYVVVYSRLSNYIIVFFRKLLDLIGDIVNWWWINDLLFNMLWIRSRGKAIYQKCMSRRNIFAADIF